jgi:hypothetical protein
LASFNHAALFHSLLANIPTAVVWWAAATVRRGSMSMVM